MKQQLQSFYLEYLNDFLTIEHFAACHEMSVDMAQQLVNIGRMYHVEITE